MGIFLFFSCASKRDLPTVKQLELKAYMGKWYEIARLPNSFEKGLKCVTAEYSLQENGKVKVVNQGIDENNTSEKSKSVGIAKRPNEEEPGRLKVSFFRPFWGKYYVIALDKEYQYALVGSPNRKYLWILSRTKTLDQKIIDSLSATAKSQGFAIENLHFTPQDCK